MHTEAFDMKLSPWRWTIRPWEPRDQQFTSPGDVTQSSWAGISVSRWNRDRSRVVGERQTFRQVWSCLASGLPGGDSRAQLGPEDWVRCYVWEGLVRTGLGSDLGTLCCQAGYKGRAWGAGNWENDPMSGLRARSAQAQGTARWVPCSLSS